MIMLGLARVFSKLQSGPAVLVVTGALVATPALADMSFSTGRQGGSQYPVSVALTQVLEKVPGIGTVSLVPGGGAANIVAVDSGQSELGITLSSSAVDGLLGKPPYKGKTSNVVQLFALQAFKIVVLVPEASPIKTLKDLQGKKVNTGPKGFTIVEMADRILAKDGVKVNMQYLQIPNAVEQFKDGNLDALIYSPSDRFAAFIDLAQARKIRLVPIPGRIIDEIIKEDPSFYRSQWPQYPEAYKGLANQVTTLGYPNIIIAHKDKVTDEQAYAMTKAAAENIEKIAQVEPDLKNWDLKNLATEVGVPIHPGAMRYFKEKGWR
jgi:TRAP transporter TAXI family solute receptor